MLKPNITDYIFNAAKTHPNSPAIYTSLEKYITYYELSEAIIGLAKQCASIGIDRHTRVAFILPNSAEALILFYALAYCGIVIPLNPNCTRDELKLYLTMTKAQVIITDKDTNMSLSSLTEELHLPIYELQGEGQALSLSPNKLYPIKEKCSADETDNTAVILLTSGTTAASKVVPLTHTNLMIPANVYKEIFHVQHTDTAVNVIPLFHIYGITGSVLVAAAAGGSIFCMPKFELNIFFDVLQKLNIKWYAAGPAIQTAIAEYAKKIDAHPEDYALTVIRSGGAALSLETLHLLETHFNAIVLSGYGLTETSGLGTTNLATKNGIKTTSVGVVNGIDINIVDDTYTKVPANQIGQIIMKGPSVIQSYENDFANDVFLPMGWFITGDLGYFDEDGFLYITGRTKELINKGGEKISPYEIERALLAHSAVADAVAFPAPHPTLGEIPMAIVILKKDTSATENELKAFLRQRVALSRIPVQIFKATSIPKNATGKVVRNSLYNHVLEHPRSFEIHKDSSNNAASNADLLHIESELQNIWKEILPIANIPKDKNYFVLGGDSLGITFLFSRIEDCFRVTLPLETILMNGTIQELANCIYQNKTEEKTSDFVIPLRLSNTQNPSVFCVHALNGDAFTYRKFSENMGDEYSIYGIIFQPHSTKVKHPVQLEQLAELYIGEMKKIQPEGPYVLLGYSLGGIIAYEMARKLRAENEEIAVLALLDTRFEFSEELVQETFLSLRNKMLAEIKILHRTSEQLQNEFKIAKMLQHGFMNYELQPYEGEVLYFHAELVQSTDGANQALSQLQSVTQNVSIVNIYARHASLIADPAIKYIAQHMKKEIQVYNPL